MNTQGRPLVVWVKNFKALKNVKLDFPTKLTIVAGPSGSGKTALAEAFLLLADAAWGRVLHHDETTRGASVAIKTTDGCIYKVRVVGAVQKDLEVSCPQGGTDALNFLKKIAVILSIDWKAARSPQPPSRQERLMPDASNFVPYLHTVMRGYITEPLVEAMRYVIPNVRDMWFEERDGKLFLKLATANGVVMDQTDMPAGVLKTLVVETAIHDNLLVVIDEFENSLHPEVQQFIIDEIRSLDTYAILITHSTVPLDYAKTPNEVVLLSLENGETKARRLGKEVEEELKRSKLTLSELIESGLLEEI